MVGIILYFVVILEATVVALHFGGTPEAWSALNILPMVWTRNKIGMGISIHAVNLSTSRSGACGTITI